MGWARPVDVELAEEIRQFRSPTDGETRMFYEIVVAPGYTPDGLERLKGKSKTLRILEAQPRALSGRSLRQIAGDSIPLGMALLGWGSRIDAAKLDQDPPSMLVQSLCRVSVLGLGCNQGDAMRDGQHAYQFGLYGFVVCVVLFVVLNG